MSSQFKSIYSIKTSPTKALIIAKLTKQCVLQLVKQIKLDHCEVRGRKERNVSKTFHKSLVHALHSLFNISIDSGDNVWWQHQLIVIYISKTFYSVCIFSYPLKLLNHSTFGYSLSLIIVIAVNISTDPGPKIIYSVVLSIFLERFLLNFFFFYSLLIWFWLIFLFFTLMSFSGVSKSTFELFLISAISLK